MIKLFLYFILCINFCLPAQGSNDVFEKVTGGPVRSKRELASIAHKRLYAGSEVVALGNFDKEFFDAKEMHQIDGDKIMLEFSITKLYKGEVKSNRAVEVLINPAYVNVENEGLNAGDLINLGLSNREKIKVKIDNQIGSIGTKFMVTESDIENAKKIPINLRGTNVNSRAQEFAKWRYLNKLIETSDSELAAEELSLKKMVIQFEKMNDFLEIPFRLSETTASKNRISPSNKCLLYLGRNNSNVLYVNDEINFNFLCEFDNDELLKLHLDLMK